MVLGIKFDSDPRYILFEKNQFKFIKKSQCIVSLLDFQGFEPRRCGFFLIS